MTAPTSIPWRLAIPVEVRCEYAQTNQGDYYGDIETCLHTERVFPVLFEQATGYRPPPSLQVPVSAYEGVAALGGGLVFPREHQPMIRDQGRILQTPEDVDALSVPDPWQSARFQAHLETWRELRCRFPDLPVGLSAGQEGPVTTAVLLRGSDFFVDCLLDPVRAHRLLSICTDTYIAFAQAVQEATHTPAEGRVGICDDHAGNLSPPMWAEFVLPYYERVYGGLGAKRRFLHTELVRREHLLVLERLRLDHLNFGENQYITVHDVVEALDVPFDWHIKTVSEMLQDTPETIDAAYRRAVADGAPEMCCELAVGTPPENIRAYIRVAQEYADESQGCSDGVE